MARKIAVTLTPLQEYAATLGLNPMHFEGAAAHGYFQHMGHCNSIWYRHSWQNPDNVSHEDLAREIRDAEIAISKEVGYNIAPKWQVLDIPYPKPRHRSMPYMRGARGEYRSINVQIGKVISGGRRGVQHIDDFTVAYVDEDNDGFEETAKIDLGAEYDLKELKVFFKGTKADPAWEIRPIRKIEDNVIYLDSWLFIDPDLKSKFPKEGTDPIQIDNATNLVTEVDVYRVYNDRSLPECQFIWDAENMVQDGYLQVLNKEAGIVRPLPATYKAGIACTVVNPSMFCTAKEPDRVRVYLYSGKQSDDYLNGYSLDPLDSYYVESITLLATARLHRNLCGCNNIFDLGQSLREDMALVSPLGNFLAVADKIQECPFGTRRGEWLAWNRLANESDHFLTVGIA